MRNAQKSPPTGRTGWQRAAILVLALAASLYTAAFSFAVVNDRRLPEIALAIFPGLVPAASQAADIRLFTAAQATVAQGTGRVSADAIPPSLITGIGVQLDPGTRSAIRMIAEQSLSSSLLAADALRQLAYLERSADRRERLLRLSQDVTRRNAFAALQLAEIELRGNRAEAGVAGLNRALIVSDRLDGAIIPLMLGAAQQPAYLEPIGDLLADDPLWASRLVDWSVANPNSLPLLAPLLRFLPAESPARAKGYGQVMVDLLAQQGSFGEAFSVYQAYASSAPRASDLVGAGFPPLDWKLIDNYDSGGRLFEDNALEFFANPGRRGEVAQLVTNLAPGRHILSLQIDETMGGNAELTLETLCLQQGGAESQLRSATAPLADGVIRFPVAVDNQCPYQRLRLVIASGNEASSALARAVNLSRVGA